MTYGDEQAVTLTVRVYPKASVQPTGVVTVRAAARTVCQKATVNGVASCGLTPVMFGAGRIEFTAHYGGSDLAPGSSGTARVQIVLPLLGYYLAGRNGTVVNAGGVPKLAGFSTPSADPLTGITTTPDGRGFFAVTADGLVRVAGDAVFRGDLAHPRPGGKVVHASDIVAIVATNDGAGHWLLGADGEVYPFGDATFHGDLLHLPGGKQVHVHNIVGMVASPSTGYLLIGADGGVFAFGAIHFWGSLPASA